ncbi:MAG: c-type cytochrome [Rhodocyclaceae bacterium]|nr:c-type cytochrome [Rhodocyclaceae bacterium]
MKLKNAIVSSTVLFVISFPSFLLGAEPSRRALEIIESRCMLCHGPEGERGSRTYPRLAAQNVAYLEKQLRDFRDGRRTSEAMTGLTRDLSDRDISQLAEYFSKSPPQSRPVRNAVEAELGKKVYFEGLPVAGVPACVACHGNDAHGTTELPRLAGQLPSYIEDQLMKFATRERTNDGSVMNVIAAGLNDSERRALGVYLGSLQ